MESSSTGFTQDIMTNLTPDTSTIPVSLSAQLARSCSDYACMLDHAVTMYIYIAGYIPYINMHMI